MTKERWIWVGGWGLEPDWFRGHAAHAFPSADHTVLAPTAGALAEVAWDRFDRAGGYSLGAFLLLKHAPAVKLAALLVAPFFAYPSEAGLGGRIRQAQIRYLGRWLQREPLGALADFYKRANLDLPCPEKLPYPIADLQWGLEQLAGEQVPAGLPEGWMGVVGGSDPLLDAAALTRVEKRLQVVPGATHHPAALLGAAARGRR
jgi:hypothetical protein